MCTAAQKKGGSGLGTGSGEGGDERAAPENVAKMMNWGLGTRGARNEKGGPGSPVPSWAKSPKSKKGRSGQ